MTITLPGQARREPVSTLDTVQAAVANIFAGRPMIIVDDENRENEGDLIMAAEHAETSPRTRPRTSAWTAWSPQSTRAPSDYYPAPRTS